MWKERKVMLFFCAGLFVGGVLGVAIMSLLVAGKQEDEYFGRE